MASAVHCSLIKQDKISHSHSLLDNDVMRMRIMIMITIITIWPQL